MKHYSADSARIRAWSNYQLAAALPDASERIMRHVDVMDNGCWIWKSASNTVGYPMISIASKTLLAHRLSLLVFNGEYEPTSDVDHLCRTPLCVSPHHLEAVTHTVNVNRGIFPDRKPPTESSVCVNGHVYAEVGIYESTRPNGLARTTCQACAKTAQVKSRIKNGRNVLKENHCRKGHEYTPENTAMDRGSRRCRTCYKIAYALRKAESDARQ